MSNLKVEQVREMFKESLCKPSLFHDDGMLELTAISFTADEDVIFGTRDSDYIKKEMDWYDSQSLSIDDMLPPIPKIWEQIASDEGYINSNYGWCLFSEANGLQYQACMRELEKKPLSRRAVMIYTRPTMHTDYKKDSMNDFICTNTVQLLIRNNKLQYIVNMRSCDAVYGYKNDIAWHQRIQAKASLQLNVPPGDITYQVGSLHIYPRHFDLVKKS
jgi:thymidylate synthase